MTGLDSFSNPESIGPLYPFVGTEIVLVIVAVALWIGWHVGQTRAESKEYEAAVELYERIGLDRAMHAGGSANIVDDGVPLSSRAGGPGTAGEPTPPPVPGQPRG